MNRLLLLVFLIFSSLSLSAQGLQARFSVDTSYGCSNKTFQFHDLSTGPNPIVAWRWKFGDGYTSEEQSPSHKYYYSRHGIEVVSLMVIDSKGDTSKVNQKDTVYVMPIAFVDYYKYYICNNGSVEIKTGGSDYQQQLNGYQTYQWSNGATTPTITVNTPGIYAFKVSTPCGTDFPDSVEVIQATGTAVITPLKVPADSVKPGGLMVSMSASLIYRDEDYGLTHWNWGDGTTSVKNAVHERVFHQYAKPGKYTITCSVTLTNNVHPAICGDTIASYLVTVSDTNEVHAKIGILSQTCNTVTFVDSSYALGVGNITSKEWYMGDGPDSVLVHTFQRDSIYTARLIVRNFYSGQNDTAYKTITIQTHPIIDLKPDTTVLQGARLTLKDLLRDVNPKYRYRWSTGDTFVLNITTPGVYKLTATYCGNITTDSINIRIATDTPHISFIYYPAELCNPYRIAFKDVTTVASSFPQDSIISYSWDFGNQTTSTDKVASAVYNPGTYNVVLKVTTLSGITATIFKPVFIGNYAWQLNIVKHTRNVNCRDTVIIDSVYATGTYGDYSITWSKPLANDSTITTSGEYVAYLKDSCGNIRNADTIFLNTLNNLSVNITRRNDTLFASTSNNGSYSWRWYRDNVQLTGETHNYITTGVKGTYKAEAVINPTCTFTSAPFGYKNQTTVDYSYTISPCNSQLYTFTGIVNSTDSLVDYKWIIGTLTSQEKNPAVQLNAGTYYVILRVINVYGDTTDRAELLTITPEAVWTATITKTAIACSDTATLTVNPVIAAGKYLWSTGDTTRTIRVTTSENYTVVLKDSCNTIRAADSLNVVIHPLIKATIRLAGNYSDTLIASAGSAYNWYLNNIALASHQQLLFPTASGSYTVAVTNAAGCTSTSAPFIYTLPIPDTVAVGSATDSTLNVSAGFNHNFNPDNVFTAELMLDNNGGRTTGLQQDEVISLGSVNSSDGNITMQVVIPDSLACADNYIIRIKASSPADTTIWSKQFSIINQPAMPVITQHGDSLLTSGIYNWQWYKNNVAIEGATNAYYRARANASYTVEAKNGTGCNSLSSAVAVVITAVGEVTLGTNTAKVFPNPSEGQVSLQFSKPLLKVVTIKVYDLHGQVHYSRTTQQQLQQMDLSHLPKGIYMIALSGYGTEKVLTIVLQ